MGWDTEFRSPIEIVGTKIVLRTLGDARKALLPANADDPDIELPVALTNVKRGLNLAANRSRPKDLSDATVATLRALRMAGHTAIMNTNYIGQAPATKAERYETPTMATPKHRAGTAKAHDPSKVPDIHEALRKALGRARSLK